ncbi:MAG: nucleotidyltransferase domain-containing protein, partial [Candidatus Aenigmarchaeota archaeon]|nr:nucleotidyltransferase domain-containing protein [Candidatus Aenigmarchaeota archaeon]
MLNLYSANIDSNYYRDVKVFYNITKLRNSGILEALDKFYMRPTIVFFGSGSYGMDIETSDFDLVIISEKTTEFKDREKFERKLNRRLQIFAVKDIKEIKNNHLINNILNGITIQGAVKWI